MLKKIAVLAFAAAAILPAAPAGAWDQVCMNLPLWKTWFAGSGYVVYDFPTASGKIPGSYYPEKEGARLRPLPLPKDLNGSADVIAQDQVRTSTIHVNQTKCVNISKIPQGKPFIVYFLPDFGKAVLCGTHHSNPDKWYHQTNRPYRTLNYETTGTTFNAKCVYARES